MDVVLRHADSAERDLLRQLVSEYLFEFDGQTEPYRYFDAYWSESDRLPFLIEADAQLAGFCLVRLRGRDWTITEFTVVPNMRRTGIGRAVVAAVVDRARVAGASYVEATVLAGRREALAFWLACGFGIVDEGDVVVTRRDI